MKFVKIADYKKTVDQFDENEMKQYKDFIEERKANYKNTYSLLIEFAQTMHAYIENSLDVNESSYYTVTDQFMEHIKAIKELLNKVKNKGGK